MFHALFQIFFILETAMFSVHEPSVATGLGANIFLAFGKYVLGFLAGAAVAQKLFPDASRVSLFYGLSAVLVLLWIATVFAGIGSGSERALVSIVVDALIVALAIFAMWILLLRRRAIKTRD